MSEFLLLSGALLLQGCSKVEVRVKGTKTVYLDLWGKEFSTNCEKAYLRYPCSINHGTYADISLGIYPEPDLSQTWVHLLLSVRSLLIGKVY